MYGNISFCFRSLYPNILKVAKLFKFVLFPFSVDLNVDLEILAQELGKGIEFLGCKFMSWWTNRL